MRDRRQGDRLSMRLNLSYVIAGSQKMGKALTADISATGVRFTAEHPLSPGDRVEVAVRVPDRRDPIRFVGEVVWSRPHRLGDPTLTGPGSDVGVRVATIDPKDQALLTQYAVFYRTD